LFAATHWFRDCQVASPVQLTQCTDYSASYEGTVSGNVFKFTGGGTDYRESGTFVLNNDGSASKASAFRHTDNSCSGTCSNPNLILQ
jgi:hypothetical protein